MTTTNFKKRIAQIAEVKNCIFFTKEETITSKFLTNVAIVPVFIQSKLNWVVYYNHSSTMGQRLQLHHADNLDHAYKVALDIIR